MEKVKYANYSNKARRTEVFREMEMIPVGRASERHYEEFMKVAFELDLKRCKAIYGLNINTPISREQPPSDELS